MPGSPWTVGGPGALNETDPVPVASRKRRSAGAGLRGDGPGGGLAPASSHLDGGSRSETSAARAVREFFCFLRDEETLSSLQRAPMQRDRDDRNAGGRTLQSEIFGGSLVGFFSSTHRSHQKPLHVLIGSHLTICEEGAVTRTDSGGVTKMQNAGLAYPHGRRRQQFSPASV